MFIPSVSKPLQEKACRQHLMKSQVSEEEKKKSGFDSTVVLRWTSSWMPT